MKLAAMKLAERVVEYEERTIFLGDLIKIKRGTREVERFVRKQEALRHEAPEMMSREDIEEMILRERDNVMDSMTNKLKDNICKGARKGRELHQLKVRLFWGMRREDDRRKFNNTLNDRLYRKRKEVRKEHQVQLRAIRIDTKKEDKLRLPPELKRYSNVKIFQKDAAESYKPGVAIGPVVVGLEQGLLDKDEIAVLCRGPKFCVRRVLSEERYMMECEKSYYKLRLDMKDDDLEDDPGGGAETEEDEVERKRIEKAAELVEIDMKTVFNEDEMTIDYGRKRATDCKHNTCVRLPKPRSAKVEQDIELRRQTWRKIYKDFRNQFTDEEGIQESNLTMEEARGLKKLQKRVKEGELVVVKSDKSGKFSIMSMDEYRRAGEVHTRKDREVTVDFLLKNQRKLNGHLSMLLKTFLVGKNHEHYERIRNLKLTHSLSVAPLYLLFKDHKGWTLSTGKPSPSRPVVSAGSGQDDHLSEIISHILEPIVKMRPGGMEMTSTGDFIALVDGINMKSILIEDINLDEVDEHLDNQAKEAQERYDRIDDENLPEGWKQDLPDVSIPEGWSLPKRWNLENKQENYTFSSKQDIPEGGIPETSKLSSSTCEKDQEYARRMETGTLGMEEMEKELESRWKDKEYRLVLDKLKLTEKWPKKNLDIKEALLGWMTENTEEVLAEEGEDILDGLEAMNTEDCGEISDDVLMDSTEIVTAIIVSRGLESNRVAPLFQQDGKKTSERIKRIGRAEGMVRMREEMRKVKNMRMKANTRSYRDSDFEDIEISNKRRADCSRRMERGVLRSDMVDTKYVQDKGQRIQVIGSDVEALYPSLAAIEVA